MKKAVLFDIDGTLLDTRKFVFDAVKYAFSESGYPYPTERELKEVTGLPLVEFYSRLLSVDASDKLAKIHREFQEENFHLVKPFPKTKKTLRILKNAGFALAAVSNRTRESLVKSLKFTGIFDFFEVVICADDVVNAKPHRESLLAALKFLQMKPNSAYMIGDTENDIFAGKNAKVKTVGVTYGWLGKDIVKYNPDHIIDDIGKLPEVLKYANI